MRWYLDVDGQRLWLRCVVCGRSLGADGSQQRGLGSSCARTVSTVELRELQAEAEARQEQAERFAARPLEERRQAVEAERYGPALVERLDALRDRLAARRDASG